MLLHPVAALLSDREYTPVIAMVTTGFCREDVKPSGPDHAQPVASLELA